MAPEITSASNPRMKRLARLARRSHRDGEGLFVVEGARLVVRAMEAGFAPVEAYGDGSVRVEGVDPTLVSPEALDRASYREHSEGLIVVFRQRRSTLAEVEPSDPALMLVAENLEKPGNLGAILRTADAVAADAVVTVPGEMDVFNPNVLRSSTGAAFTVAVPPASVGELRTWLAAHGIDLVAADPAAPRTIWEVDLSGPVALMVGAEDDGLSAEAREAADELVSIPMAGSVDSLNASVAMAVMAFEARRQRALSP